jgi:hypothetical protein
MKMATQLANDFFEARLNVLLADRPPLSILWKDQMAAAALGQDHPEYEWAVIEADRVANSMKRQMRSYAKIGQKP